MTTTQEIKAAKVKAKADAKALTEFVGTYGHTPDECLPGCIRVVKRSAKNPDGISHRQSNARPGDMKGKPFTETWEERKIRRAARAQGKNGPVTVLVAAAHARLIATELGLQL